MKRLTATTDQEVAYQDLVAPVRKHADTMTPLELLAVASNMLGKLVAMQDQRTTTMEQAMSVVARNIEFGNQQAIAKVMKSAGRA